MVLSWHVWFADLVISVLERHEEFVAVMHNGAFVKRQPKFVQQSS